MTAQRQRAAKGAGTVEWHRDRFRVRIVFPDGRRRSYSCEVGQTREQAEAFRAALLLELAGTDNDPKIGIGTPTLGAWAGLWLDARERTHRDASGDRQRWNAYAAGTSIASVRLDALTATHVHRWASELVHRKGRSGEPLARQTARNAWSTFRAVVRGAGKAGRLDAARAAAILAVELPDGPIEASDEIEMDERIAVLTPAEIARVLALPLTPDQRSAFVVALYQGMRAGELHGLAWERVRFDEGRIIVARSRGGATKAGKVAAIPMLAPARAVLLERWTAAGKPATGLVWPAEHGGCHARGFDWGWSDHPSATFVRLGVRRLARARPEITLRDFRHTCGSFLLRGMWAPDVVPRRYSLEEVSRFLRHSSIKVTEKHYASLDVDALPVSSPPSPPSPQAVTRPIHSEPVFSVDSKPHPGFEPGTYGLRNRPAPEELRGVSPRGGLVGAARDTLEAIAEGDPRALALATDLASRVLASAALEADDGARKAGRS